MSAPVSPASSLEELVATALGPASLSGSPATGVQDIGLVYGAPAAARVRTPLRRRRRGADRIASALQVDGIQDSTRDADDATIKRMAESLAHYDHKRLLGVMQSLESAAAYLTAQAGASSNRVDSAGSAPAGRR